MTRDDLLEALQHHNVQAFLRVIRAGESSQDDSAYTVMYGGKHFESMVDHPRQKNTARGITSTAAGAYQFLARTWDDMARLYGLNDFGPVNQDIAACGLIARRGALQLVKEGRIREAIARCAREWASLPGSPYGQPTLTLEKALAVYRQYGGRLADAPAKPAAATRQKEVKTMGFPIIPLITAFGPELVKLIPMLGQILGSGSEQQKQNVAAATAVVDTIVKATESPNLQAAVERMQEDPEALRAAQHAISDILPTLVEAGGGGIDGARKASADPNALPFWRQPAFVFAMAALPLVYMLAISVLFGVGGVSWSDEVRVMVATGFIGLLGSGAAFFWGSSLGSQKKDAMLGSR